MGWIMNALYLGVFVGVAYQVVRKLAPSLSIGSHLNIKKISEFQKKNRARKLESLKGNKELLDLEVEAAQKQAKIAKAKRDIRDSKGQQNNRNPLGNFGNFGGNGGFAQGNALDPIKRLEKDLKEMEKRKWK